MSEAILNLEGKSYRLPVVEGTEKERAIDISALRDMTGYITLDTGYQNTGSCMSSITYIDGEKGILRYRGYPIEQLAERGSFTETCFLLMYGELPKDEERRAFSSKLTESSMIHEDMVRFFDGFPSTAHPMAILSTMVNALSVY